MEWSFYSAGGVGPLTRFSACVCLFALSRCGYPSTSSTPKCPCRLFNLEIRALPSQSHDKDVLHFDAARRADNALTCRRTRYEKHIVHTPAKSGYNGREKHKTKMNTWYLVYFQAKKEGSQPKSGIPCHFSAKISYMLETSAKHTPGGQNSYVYAKNKYQVPNTTQEPCDWPA